VLVLAVFGLPRLLDDEPLEEQAIVVSMVPLAEETNIPDPVPPPKLPEEDLTKPEPPPDPEPPPPEPEPEPSPPEPLPPEPEPEPLPPEPEPEPLPPEPTVEAPASIPKPTVKPEAPPPPDPFDTLLKDLTEVEERVREREEPEEAAPAPSPEEIAGYSPRVTDEPLSMTVIDLIRRQVESNWSVPVGVKDAAELVVEIRIRLLPDGQVVTAEIVDVERMGRSGQESFRTMAESARRAVLKASPLRGLPPEKFEAWRDIQLNFRPPV
jgi:hypothetical protein